jgi:hypothetical protein
MDRIGEVQTEDVRQFDGMIGQQIARRVQKN